MVFLMSKNRVRALVIVEGEKTEKEYFSELASRLKLKFDIIPFKANIYELYSIMKKNDFNLNIKDILIEKFPFRKDDLSGEFAYFYLVFDLDLQHHLSNERRRKEEILSYNLLIVNEMTQKCINETDPTLGKLYVNYPMFESFRCCDSFFDDNYKNEYVKIDEVKKFKNYCSNKKLAGVSVSNYSEGNFIKITKQNIYKLNYMYNNLWARLLYANYLLLSDQTKILLVQIKSIEEHSQIAVLNTSVFLILDYFGEKYFNSLSDDSFDDN